MFPWSSPWCSSFERVSYLGCRPVDIGGLAESAPLVVILLGMWHRWLASRSRLPTHREAVLTRRERIIQMVSADGMALRHAPEEFRSDRGITLAAAHSNGHALRFADATYLADIEVVLAALRSAKLWHALHWSPLAHAIAELRDNRELVLCAVTVIEIPTLRIASAPG